MGHTGQRIEIGLIRPENIQFLINESIISIEQSKNLVIVGTKSNQNKARLGANLTKLKGKRIVYTSNKKPISLLQQREQDEDSAPVFFGIYSTTKNEFIVNNDIGSIHLPLPISGENDEDVAMTEVLADEDKTLLIGATKSYDIVRSTLMDP